MTGRKHFVQRKLVNREMYKLKLPLGRLAWHSGGFFIIFEIIYKFLMLLNLHNSKYRYS